ncbi:MAG: UDP-N-acetylmuramate dehydrogenase [Alphaproteobacteria bacterium]
MFNIFNKSSLIKTLPKVRGKYTSNVKLSRYTWFGVGGPAEVFYEPCDVEDLSFFMQNRPQNIPFFLIGGGSNLLVRDGGIMGVVIRLSSSAFKKVEIDETSITLGAGMPNALLKKTLLEEEIGGLEFLCSIPGFVGGSVRTNAGCFGSSVSDFIVGAKIIDETGEIRNISLSDLKLGYRTSMFPDHWIVVSITFRKEYKKREDILAVIDEHKRYRLEKQPHNQKTAGSTFKNPEGLRAWELIKKAGCENLNIGGAKVSEKHCNFLINTGKATADDIETLGEEIISKVKEKSGVVLEWEVKRVGVK